MTEPLTDEELAALRTNLPVRRKMRFTCEYVARLLSTIDADRKRRAQLEKVGKAAREFRDIHKDYEEFDGDRRGHWEALQEAREGLFAALAALAAPGIRTPTMDDPKVIWLSPWCDKCAAVPILSPEESRLWCEVPQADCEECGRGWVRYVIGDKDAPNE